jgi:hypothetical protein
MVIIGGTCVLVGGIIAMAMALDSPNGITLTGGPVRTYRA